MEVYIDKWFYTTDKCKKNSDKLYIFGDNEGRVGHGGQAIIREERNAIGISTKKSIGEYYSDDNLAENMKVINADIERVKAYAEEEGFKALVFPYQGIGTGLSSLQNYAPKTLCHLTLRLLEEFNFNNLSALKSK